MGKNLTREFRTRKYAHWKIPGKNRIRKIREKSGFEIQAILDKILRMVYIKYSFMVKLGSFYEIFADFDIFKIAICRVLCTNSWKSLPDFFFP